MSGQMGRRMSTLIWVLQIQGWSVIHRHKKAGICSRWGLQWVIILTDKDVDKIKHHAGVSAEERACD